MTQDPYSPESLIVDIPSAQSTGQEKKPRQNLIRWLGGGCLVIILCIGAGFGTLYFSGVLSGTHGNRNDMPSWSPDGSLIAFESNRDGFSDIYVMNVDGSHIKQLTRDPFANIYFIKSPTDTTPTWSLDGKQIAFAGGRDNGMMSYVNLNIYVMNADGSNVVQLSHSNRVETSPVWSPDGKKIAFTSGEKFTSTGLVQNPTWDIFMMDVDASHVIQLTNDSANDYGIAWSPDSRQIAFASDRKGTLDLFVMNADGTGVVQLTSGAGNDGAPAWSPDGSRIAFVSDRGGKQDIYVMNADGSNIIRLTHDQGDASHPSWSPDGNRIAFALDINSNSDIYTMNSTDGSNILKLTGK